MLLILFGVVGVGVRALLSSKNPATLAAAGMCSWFGVKLAMGNLLGTNPTYYLVLVCFGLCTYRLTHQQTSSSVEPMQVFASTHKESDVK